MANYTVDEVQTAVEKIVRSTVRHPTGSLGERSVGTSFSDLQEAASGVYILYFNAPYYTLLLGVRRLADSLTTQASTIASLIDAVLATRRMVTPVNDLSNLANAKAALEELQAAVTTRSSSFNSIQAVPAFRRYATNIDAFLNTQGANVKGSSIDTAPGDSSSEAQAQAQAGASSSIVDTPAGARAKIPNLVTMLKTQQEDIVRRVGLLSGALADFTALNLPSIAAQGVISRAHDVLSDHFTTLSGLDENTRLESLRGVVLDLLTQRPLVEKYGAGQNPSEYITTQGLAKGFSDALHLATPATATSTIAGPYNIVDTSHFIKLTIDGGAPFEFPLPLGYVAQLNGTLAEPFALDSSSNRLTVVFGDPNGVGPTDTRVIVLTTGTRTSQQVATELNTGLAGLELTVNRVMRPVRYANPMTIAGSRFTVLAGGLTGFGILVGDQVDILEGANAGTTVTVASIDPAGLFFDVTGGALTAEPLPGVSVQVGPAARALQFLDTNPSASLVQRRSIRLKATGGVEDLTAALLGFAAGLEVRSYPVLATDIATNVNTSTSLFAADVLDTADVGGSGYVDLADATHVTMSDFLGEGTLTGGTTVTFGYGPDVVMPDGPGKLVVRASATSADVGKEGTVSSKDLVARTMVVVFTSSVTAGDVSAEIGPEVSFTYGDPFVISDGPNQGRYTARESQGVKTTASFEILLDRVLPAPKTGGTANTVSYHIGKSYLTFESTLKQTTSSVRVENGTIGTAAEYFFETVDLPATGEGTTSYLKFDTFPPAAAVGDLVQLFEDQYNLVSREFEIVGIEPSASVIKLSRSVESDFSMTFDQGVPNPFGAIRISQTANYGDFKMFLDLWLQQRQLTTAYYRDLARFLNPVLTNANPTSAAVDDATNQLKSLSSILTEAGAAAYGGSDHATLEYALDLYSSPVEPSVDALISTFRNKGADRAIDLLLEGQFSTFFGLDLNTISYSGTLTQASRDVAMNDLPIRKNNRSNALGQQLIGTISNQPDHEYDFSDQDSAIPDIPGNPDVSGPGDSY